MRKARGLVDAGGHVETLNSFAYNYNQANQRTRVTLADGSYWLYEYDSLGQVKSGKKYWYDGTPVAGQQFEYAFDDIGNRKNTKAGGDENGAYLRLANNTNNSLNQITSRGVPGYVDIMGLSFATNSVTVNSQTAYRKGEYFHREISIANGSGPVWQSVTVSSGGSNVTGNLLFPPYSQSPTYDADGNLSSDGLWTYAWDAENRLLSVTSQSTVPSSARRKVECAYDHQGQRIQKIVSTWNGSAYVAQSTNRFVYDGWNLVAVLSHTNGLVYSFTWGTDLSGSLQGAGGVGGLISMTVHSGPNAGTYFYCFDGNGNVVALVNAADSSVAARYEYGAFGELLRATGPLAPLNPFLFSTKFYDWETGLYYYGYRYYDPIAGRWPSRDPIGEQGGINLYSFIANQPISWVDINGLYQFMGLNYTYGTANGPIGPGTGAFGNTRWRSGILKLRPDMEMLECGLCCLKDVEFYLKLTVSLPVVGDVLEIRGGYGFPGSRPVTITATEQYVANITAHEQVHVQHSQALANAIFPAIEGQCRGKCWRKPFGGLWSKNECYRFLFDKMSAYDQKVTDWNQNDLGNAWHGIHFAGAGGRQSYQIPVTADMLSTFQAIQDAKITAWSSQSWCSDGF